MGRRACDPRAGGATGGANRSTVCNSDAMSPTTAKCNKYNRLNNFQNYKLTPIRKICFMEL